MATTIQLEKNGALKKSYLGFSWTTFFFGFFVPLFRGDAMWFIVMLILNACTLCMAQLILSFLYNIKNHQVAFIAKDSLGKIPIFGKWVLRIRGIYIHRGDARASLKTINEGVDYLKQGFSLVIFPEGTRSQSSELGEFKPGSFKLATKSRVPVVPVTLNGGYHTFEERGAVTKGCHIDFMVHEPILTKDMSRQELAELPHRVEEIIRGGLEILTAETDQEENKDKA